MDGDNQGGGTKGGGGDKEPELTYEERRLRVVEVEQQRQPRSPAEHLVGPVVGTCSKVPSGPRLARPRPGPVVLPSPGSGSEMGPCEGGRGEDVTRRSAQ